MRRFATLLTAGLILAACGSSAPSSPVAPDASASGSPSSIVATPSPTATPVSPTIVTVRIDDTSLTVSPATATNEVVVFTIANAGKRDHQLVLVRADGAPAKLPLDGKIVDLTKVTVVGVTGKIAKGETNSLSIVGQPKGAYLLFSNLPGDYTKGLVASFEIK